MSEGCTSCRGANYGCGGGSGGGSSGGGLQLGVAGSGASGCGGCHSSATGPGSAANSAQPTKRRVLQVRAKVLYGSGKAIASLQAQEKAARRH